MTSTSPGSSLGASTSLCSPSRRQNLISSVWPERELSCRPQLPFLGRYLCRYSYRLCVNTAVDIWMSSPDVLEVLDVAGPGHQHAVTLGHGGRQHRQPHYQTVVTRTRTYSGVQGQHAFKYLVVLTCEGAVVCVPAPGQGGVRGAAHDDGVEHAHGRAAQQLRGRRGQRGEVERVAEVVVDPLRPLAEARVPGSLVTRSRGHTGANLWRMGGPL